MYTPITWANPNNLMLIKEKRQNESLENLQVKKAMHQKKAIKTKLMDALNKSFPTKWKPSFGM